MALIGEHIPDYVQEQIQIRQKTHGSGVFHLRTDDQLLTLNSKTSFIKLASGVWMEEEKLREIGVDAKDEATLDKWSGMGLAKEHVLFGGYARMTPNELNQEILVQRSGFLGNNGSYEASKPWGIVPMPGIDSIDVKSMNRGSLKKATVKLTAQNRDQLAILDVLYLRLGYTVLLEWGNTIYIDNDGNIQKSYVSLIEGKKGFFDEAFSINDQGIGQTSFKPILSRIKTYRDKSSGNYDALLGKVSNFNWSFNPDGSYSIEITIISLGDVVESLKTNVPAVSSTLTYVNDESLGYTQENDALDQHRKDNIILSLLHIFRLQNRETNIKGAPIHIKTHNNVSGEDKPANLGNLCISGSENITFGNYEVTLEAFNGFLFKHADGSYKRIHQFVESDNNGGTPYYVTEQGNIVTKFGKVQINTLQTVFGAVEVVPFFNADDFAKTPALTNTLESGGTVIQRLIFQQNYTTSPSNYFNRTISETKTFSEIEIENYRANPTDESDPNGVAVWIKQWKEKYVFEKIDTVKTIENGTKISPQWTVKQGWTGGYKDIVNGDSRQYPESLPPRYFYKSIVNPPKIKRPDASTKNIKNPLVTTGYQDNDAFLLKMAPKQYYIRFGYLLKLLKNKVITRIDVGNSDRLENPNIFNIDTGYTPMLCLPLQISFDWRTCIVARNDFNRPGTYNQNIFPELKPWVQSKNVADAMNIYLNFNFIADAMISNSDAKGNVSVYDFVKAMCDGINKALAGVNNLEPIIDEEDNTLKIFDSTSRPKEKIYGEADPKYKLQLYGYGDGVISPKESSTFVRKVDLKTAITPEYATMITVGATAGGYVKGTEATAFARWNHGIKDRFKTKLISADPDAAKDNKPDDNNDDARNAFFNTNSWTAKCFGIEPSSGDKSAYLWGMFPEN